MPVGDAKKCELMGWFGILVQCTLGAVIILALVIKRQVEKPRRKWKIWFLDVTKQCLGAVTAHVFNVGVSILYATSDPDAQCAWYFLAMNLDVVLGTFICYVFLRLSNKVYTHLKWTAMVSGNYGDPPDLCRWAGQTTNWVWIVIVSKGFIAAVLFVARDQLLFVAKIVLKPVSYFPKIQLVIVMMILPAILNALQFWVQDTFLKMKFVGRFMSFRIPGLSRAGLNEDDDVDGDGVAVVTLIDNDQGALASAYGKGQGPIIVSNGEQEMEVIVRGMSPRQTSRTPDTLPAFMVAHSPMSNSSTPVTDA